MLRYQSVEHSTVWYYKAGGITHKQLDFLWKSLNPSQPTASDTGDVTVLSA